MKFFKNLFNPIDSVNKPSVKTSVKEGMYSAAMIGAGETFISPCAVYLHASGIILGILQSLPTLFGALFQLLGVYFAEHGFSRKKTLTNVATLQAIVWMGIAMTSISGYENAAELLLLVVSFHYIANGVVAPVWSSLIGDLVDSAGRGKFLGERNRKAGLMTFVSMLFAGSVISFFSNMNQPALGFAVTFAGVACSRLMSVYYFNQHQDIRLNFYPEAKFSLWQFLWRLPYSNFARFVSFFSFFHFSVWISAPFLSVYMLKDLGLSYAEFTILSAATIVSQFFMLPKWGEIIDKYGNKRVLSFCSTGVSLIPIFWIMNANFYYLICIQLYSGIMWSGFNTSASNFLFDAVTPEKRARCVAYQAIINGTMVLAGSLLGGYFVDHLYIPMPFYKYLAVPNSIYLTLFFISSALRTLTSIFFLGSFKEIRQVEALELREFFFVVVQELPLIGRIVKHKEDKEVR